MNSVQRIPSLAWAAVLFWLVLGSGIETWAQGIKAELTPPTFAVDQTAQLLIHLDGARDAHIDIAEVDHLTFQQGGKSSNIQIINGAITASVTYSYSVQAQQPGTYTIPEITAVIDNEKYQTEPISFSVTAAAAPAPQSPGRQPPDISDSIAFIKFMSAKNKSYLGEVVSVQIKAYFRQGARIDQISLPRFQGEGLLIDELDRNPRQVEEIIDNAPYRVLVWDSFVTGVKEGTYPVGVGLDANLLIPSGRRSPGFGSNFFNDDFFDDFFTSYQSKPIKAASPETEFQVMALPDTAKPEGFAGAVGNFSLELEANPTEVRVGEPITLSMTVSGTGNFNRVEAPVISDAGNLKLYTPSGEFKSGSSPYEGSKHFEQAAVITDPNISQIPPVVFSFFNPDTGQYQTTFSDPVDITVTPAVGKTMVQALPSDTDTPEPESFSQTSASAQISLLPVRLETGRLVDKIRPPFLAPWFIGAMSICLAMITGLFGYGVYIRFQSKNPDVIHRKAVASQKKSTRELLRTLDPEDPGYLEQARAAIEKLLITLHRSKSTSLTVADVIDIYGEDSAATEIFRLADQSRYGRIESKEENRKQLHHNILDFIQALS